MNQLIKNIRTYLNMSQAEFAEKLNVTFATVNRWENGRAVPNKLAQVKIYDMCKEKAVPVYEMMLQNIEDIAKGLGIDSNRILLYHGSKSGIEGKIAPLSRKECDFGKGFYIRNMPSSVCIKPTSLQKKMTT